MDAEPQLSNPTVPPTLELPPAPSAGRKARLEGVEAGRGVAALLVVLYRAALHVEGDVPGSTVYIGSERDSGKGAGLNTSEREQVKVLERENLELKGANEILRKTSEYFAQAELDGRGKRWWRPPAELEQVYYGGRESCAVAA